MTDTPGTPPRKRRTRTQRSAAAAQRVRESRAQERAAPDREWLFSQLRAAPDREWLFSQLRAMTRDPMREVCADFYEGRPTVADIRAMATARPDRWAQGWAIALRGAGYTEKLEVEGSIEFNVKQLSDAELEVEIARLTTRPLRAIEGGKVDG